MKIINLQLSMDYLDQNKVNYNNMQKINNVSKNR